jgi:hypothetical protein
MKKAEYQKPEVEVIEISVSNMLSTSIDLYDEEEDIDGRTQKRRVYRWGNFWEEDTKR